MVWGGGVGGVGGGGGGGGWGVVVFFLMMRRPPRSTLFPYTRSSDLAGTADEVREKVAQYMADGCTCPILYPLGPDVRLMIDTFADWTP